MKMLLKWQYSRFRYQSKTASMSYHSFWVEVGIHDLVAVLALEHGLRHLLHALDATSDLDEVDGMAIDVRGEVEVQGPRQEGLVREDDVAIDLTSKVEALVILGQLDVTAAGRRRDDQGCHLNIKTVFPGMGISFYKDKTVSRPSYLYNGNLHTYKTASLYWAALGMTSWNGNAFRFIGTLWEEPPVDSPHKGSVMWRFGFPCC